MTASHILVELVIVLGSAALVTVLFQALRLPVVLGYVLAGLAIGPHLPMPLVADVALIHVLSELGVILLMFTIGLELPLRSFVRIGLPGALTALFEVALVVAVGTLVARLVGFGPGPAVFAGACLGISSTMLVAKAFDELGWKAAFTHIVFAILVFEDLIAIILLAVIAAVTSGRGLDPSELAAMLAELAGFLVLILVGGVLVVPRVIRWVATRARRETLAITSLLVCFGMSALAARAGYSVALGAFIAGVLIAESGHGGEVFRLVEVLRDVFAMVFFVSVGMSIDPALLASEAPRILLFVAVVLVAKPVGVATGVFLTGRGVSSAVRAGLSLAQIGELSFVIAGVAGSPELLAIAVGVSCITMITSPVLIQSSEAIAAWVAGRLPRGIGTFVSFYESWLGRLRARGTARSRRNRRAVIVLALETIVLAAMIIASATIGRRVLERAGVTGVPRAAVQIAAVALAGAPVALDMVRHVALLARRLAVEVIPRSETLDLGRAPRRTLVITLELAIALAIVVPIVATVQPFVPNSFAVLIVIGPVMALAMRRSIADFEGHVHASSELIVEHLAMPEPDGQLERIGTILPGFGGTVTITIPEGARAVGSSLAQLDLRARTGATVLAIIRGTEGLATPSPAGPLRAGDVLALAGSEEATLAARELLTAPAG